MVAVTSEQIGQLDGLLETEDGLTPRELDFIEDLDQSWRDRELSDRQAAWLEDLYYRKSWA